MFVASDPHDTCRWKDYDRHGNVFPIIVGSIYNLLEEREEDFRLEDLFELYGELIVITLWGSILLDVFQWMLQMVGG